MIGNGTIPVPQPTVAFIQVVSDPRKAAPDNPNGIGIASNMKIVGAPELPMIQMLLLVIQEIENCSLSKIKLQMRLLPKNLL